MNRENSIGKFFIGGILYFLNLILLCCNIDGSVSSYAKDQEQGEEILEKT